MKKKTAIVYAIVSFIVAAVLSVAYVFLMQNIVSSKTKSNIKNYTNEVSAFVNEYADTSYQKFAEYIEDNSSLDKESMIENLAHEGEGISVSATGYFDNDYHYHLYANENKMTSDGTVDFTNIKENKTFSQKISIIDYSYLFGGESGKTVLLYILENGEDRYFVIQDFETIGDVIENTYGKNYAYYFVCYDDGIIADTNYEHQGVLTLSNIFSSDDILTSTQEKEYVTGSLKDGKNYYFTSAKILSSYNSMNLNIVVATATTYLTGFTTLVLYGTLVFAGVLTFLFVSFVVVCAVMTARAKTKYKIRGKQIDDTSHYLLTIDNHGRIVSRNNLIMGLGIKSIGYLPSCLNVLELSAEDDNFMKLISVNKGFTTRLIDKDGVEHYIKFLALKSNFGYQLLGDDIDSDQAMASVSLASKKEEKLIKDKTGETTENVDVESLLIDDSYSSTYTRKALNIELNKIILDNGANSKKLYLFYFGNINLDEILRTYGASIEELINVYTIKLVRKIVGEKVRIYNVDDHHFAFFYELENSFTAFQKMMDKFDEEIKKPAKIFSNELQLEIGIGAYSFGTNGVKEETPKALINKASLAYLHTIDLVNRFYYLYDNTLDLVFNADKIIEKDIKKGLEKNEFVTYFQPNFSLKDNKVSGFECLLRWHNDKYRYDSPYKYIKVAEKVGLINEIGFFTLVESFKLMQRLNDPSLHISVNVSPAQFLQPGFTSKLVHLYAEYNVPYECICLEITETFLIQSMNDVVEKLKYLRSYGIKIYLDDFGTGYSSLMYLAELPVDVIKIDKAFITPLKTSKSARTIVSELIQIANQLGISTVAEGVEDDYQVSFLEKKGCNNIQGYYFSKAVPIEKVDEALKITRTNRM